MSNGRPEIVIEGTFQFPDGDARTLWPLAPERDRERHAFWFCAELVPGAKDVRFRITPEAIERMAEDTPEARGERLAELLIAWLRDSPDNHLAENVNDFQVHVSDEGKTTIEPRDT